MAREPLNPLSLICRPCRAGSGTVKTRGNQLNLQLNQLNPLTQPHHNRDGQGCGAGDGPVLRRLRELGLEVNRYVESGLSRSCFIVSAVSVLLGILSDFRAVSLVAF